MEEYREIELYETKLRVYRDGTIWRLNKGNRWGYEWKLLKGSINCGYLRTKIQSNTNVTSVYIHRIIAFVYLGLDLDDKTREIDHINRIKNDNRLENLRIVTHQQNQFNQSNTKGYYFNKQTGKYHAHIRVNGKLKHLGCFTTEEEASNAYQSAKLVHHVI